jgi:hypothetical protein
MLKTDRQTIKTLWLTIPGNGHGKQCPWFPNHGGIVLGKAGQ